MNFEVQLDHLITADIFAPSNNFFITQVGIIIGVNMSSQKSTTSSKSFRFSKETAELIKAGAASHRCSQVQYLAMLVRQEKAKDEKESKLISFVLARQNSKLEKLEYSVEDLGSMLMDLIILLFHDSNKPGEGHKKLKDFSSIHLNNIANGQKGFSQRLYGFTDESVNWEQVQARAQELCNQRKSKQDNGGEK